MITKEEIEKAAEEWAGTVNPMEAFRAGADFVLKEIGPVLVEANLRLRSCREAMQYAYEDHADQYYLNVADDIELTLFKLGELRGEK